MQLSKSSWVRRRYECDACGHKFEHTCRRDDPDPACPMCEYAEAARDLEAEQAADAARFKDMIDSGRPPAVTTHKSRAIDITQQVAEDMGLTDIRDNVRPGEAYYKPDTPISTSEAEAQARDIIGALQASHHQVEAVAPHLAAITGSADPVESFWGGNGAVQGKPGPGMPPAANITGAAPAAAAARAEGNDPMAKLHEAGKRGLLPTQLNVMGKADIPTGT